MNETLREYIAKSVIGLALLALPGALPIAAAVALYRRFAYRRI